MRSKEEMQRGMRGSWGTGDAHVEEENIWREERNQLEDAGRQVRVVGNEAKTKNKL